MIKHFSGIVINHMAVIGYNFIIGSNVVIGKKGGGEPIIGNNVQIGVNAVLIGSTKIRNNVVIGAGNVVTHVVTDNAVASGNPARVLYKL